MILDEIVAKTKVRLEENKKKLPPEELQKQALSMAADTGFPFEKALKAQGLSFICEVKKASPSKGLIAPDFPYVAIAEEYEKAGANAISVLTEPYFFQGSDSYLQQISEHVSIPLLRKDFTIDPYMIYEAKVIGASAILLICAILTDEQLKSYYELATSLGLSVLVEAHDEKEVRRAIAIGADIIGVNNRDPEGYSIEQIAAKCEEHGICSADEFLNEVKNGNHQIPFSTGDMNTDGVKYDLQGYLFPATYDIYDDTTAASLIDTMLEKFQSVYTSEYSAKAAELGYTDYQILIMASIVEREAKIDSERPIIAGVIYNRLNIDMMLQMCPTVLYPLTDGMYDKTEVTYDDLEIESPYNTYRNTGLPVGPICNPGQASLEAVLYPDENDYLYYHTSDGGDGSHIFSSTYDEHINTQ